MRLVEAYTKEQGLFRTDETPDPIFSDRLELDLAQRRADDGRTEAAAGQRAADAGESIVRKNADRGSRNTSACKTMATNSIWRMARW